MDKLKAGIKTSEFWATIVAANLMVVADVVGYEISDAKVMSIAAMVVGFIWSRTVAKKAVIK